MAKHIKHALKLDKRPNDKKCDLTIAVGDESIRVHRSKLLKTTRYFEENYPLSFDNLNDVCKVDGFSFDAVSVCVNFVYKKKVSPKMETVAELVNLSRKWQIEELICICKDFLRKRINTISCVEVKKLAQKVQDDSIEKEADEYILAYLGKVVECGGVKELLEVELTSIFSDYQGPDDEFGIPDLKERDTILWKLLIKWVKSQDHEGEPAFCPLLQRVPFSFFNAALLENEILEEPLVRDCEQCSNYITNSLLDILEHRLEFDKKVEDFGLEDQFCTPQESFFLLSFAQSHKREDIVKKIDESVKRCFASIIHEPEYKRLPKEELLRYLRSPGIGLKSEVELWDAIMSWIEHDHAREVDFLELFNIIKLENMPTDFLHSVILKEKLVSNSQTCKDMLLEALFKKQSKG